MGAIAKQPPIVKSSAYLTTVPFDSRLYLAEAVLTTSDILTPDTSRPVAGAKTVYKLTGDGIHFPTFSVLFQKNQGSADFDKQEGVINIITFHYDGAQFWYSITAYATLDAPPYQVGDYGLDDSVIVVAAHNVVASIYLTEVPQPPQPGPPPPPIMVPTGYVSVYDFLSSVHYKGIGQLQYYIRLQGALDWVVSPNAKDAKIEVDCNYLGLQVFEIQVGDGDLLSEIVTCTCQFEDEAIVCGN